MKQLTLISLIFIIAGNLFAYQWPSNKDFLSSLFGTTYKDSIQDGIEFISEDQAIYPLADGEIIFYQEGFEFGDLDYYGEEGNILVLKHAGEFKSIYRNFNSTDNFTLTDKIFKTEMLGVSSNEYDNFIFSIYDDKKESYINPQQILPFLEDDRTPVINGVYVKSQNERIKLSRNKKLTSGEFTIFVDAWDIIKVRDRYMKFVPFSVNVFVDGFERYNISFSSLKEIDNTLYISGESDYSLTDFLSGGTMLYGGEVFLTTGRSLIEIVIKDIEGNEASKSYSVIVD